MKPILNRFYNAFKDIDRYDFTHQKFVYYDGKRMTKHDIAFHLEALSNPHSPWTIMYDVFYYSQLKEYLKTRLNNLKNEKDEKGSIR